MKQHPNPQCKNTAQISTTVCQTMWRHYGEEKRRVGALLSHVRAIFSLYIVTNNIQTHKVKIRRKYQPQYVKSHGVSHAKTTLWRREEEGWSSLKPRAIFSLYIVTNNIQTHNAKILRKYQPQYVKPHGVSDAKTTLWRREEEGWSSPKPLAIFLCT